MRTLIIGERFNQPSWRPRRGWTWKLALRLGAFGPRSREKLARIGVDGPGLNLTPPDPQGVLFDAIAAEEFVRENWLNLTSYDTVYLAGRRVTKAVLRVVQLPNLIMIPHPSGLNRFWNDPEAVEILHDHIRQRR